MTTSNKDRTRSLIGALAVLTFGSGSALAQGPQGDPARGRDLAQRLCSSCHLVGPEHRGPVPDAIPSFMSIAARPGETENHLLAVLISPPHPVMPDPPLDRQQMRDVAAYILSLRRP